MGDFSVPSILIGKALQGAVNRVREHQDEDWEEEKRKRDAYMAQLSALIPTAATGADIEAINEEIARVQGEPREKPFKPRLLKTPSFAPPKVQGGNGGAAGGSQQATPFDFREVMAALTGAGPQRSGMPDVPNAQGGPPESVGAIPPELMALLGSGAPPAPTGAPMVPPVGAGSLGATGAMTPPDTPKVMTPPGRNVPEPSPLVGTLPGTPSPVGASPTAGATPPLVGTPLPAVPPSPFMGIRERARLPFELATEFGTTKSGQSIIPRLSIEELRDKTERELRVKEARAAAAMDLQEAQLQLAQLRAAGLTPGTRQYDDAQRRYDIAERRLGLATESLELARQNAGSYVPLTDDYGVVTGAWNPKTGGYATPPVPGTRKSAIPAGERDAASTADGMVTDLKRVSELAQRYSGEIGPVSGRLSTLTSKFVDKDPEFNELQQIVGSLKNRLIYLKSGKQINESEYKRLADTMPSMEQPLSRFFTNLARMEEEMAQVVARNAAKTAAGRTLVNHRWGKPITEDSGPVSEWERDPKTGKLRKVK